MNEFNPSGPEGPEQSPIDISKEKVSGQENKNMLSLLEQHGTLAATEPTLRGGKREGVYYGERRNDVGDEGGSRYEKGVLYEKDGDTETDVVYASHENVETVNDKGQITKREGQNLDTNKLDHAWESEFEYDDESGEMTREAGKTTGGENAGESYEKRFETDQHGKYQRKSEINTVTKFEGKGSERKPITVTNIKREHFDDDGNLVFGYQQNVGDSEPPMMWDENGDETNIVPKGITIEIN